MKKLLIIILLSSCSPKGYVYREGDKQGVRYKKAHKEKVRYLHVATAAFFLGMFIIRPDDTSTR